MATTLVHLPEDVLLVILDHLATTRDLCALSLSCRALHHVISASGWRIFVRACFPSLTVPLPPPAAGEGWRKLAQSLTWQSRCWDRRSLRFHAILPPRLDDQARAGGSRAVHWGPQQSRRRGQQTTPYHPVIDVRTELLGTGHEVVVWAEGEDVMVRYRERRGPGNGLKGKWRRSVGEALGYRSGVHDVRALALLDRDAGFADGFGMLVGRHNGHLALLKANDGEGFGEQLATFGRGQSETDIETPAKGAQPVYSMDVLPRGSDSRIVVTTKSRVLIYGVPNEPWSEVQPLTTWDLPLGRDKGPKANASCAKWMADGTLLALALHGCPDPLRYLSLSPAGEWVCHATAKNARLESHLDLKYGNICAFSLQPVAPLATSRKGSSLLLSSWNDGTCRLQDLRTPSPFDAVYEDLVNPDEPLDALLTYGIERFLGGGLRSPTLKIFDFRWTKGYYHTAGLPCTGRTPFPQPPSLFVQSAASSRNPHRIGEDTMLRSQCDPLGGAECRWHALSCAEHYRPNATIYLSNSLPVSHGHAGVWTLAKGSDAAPNFYVGISGGIVEADLAQGVPESISNLPGAEDVDEDVDPNFGFAMQRPEKGGQQAAPATQHRLSKLSRYSLMETGHGRAIPQKDRSFRLPAVLVSDSFQGRTRCEHDRLDWRLAVSSPDNPIFRRRM
ncbi:hypothetical protein P8C59_008870 [Phyllachora maydis]|uniref:F-box domain-containing protein n=1 Tax=Phyllachora maydis TaxID=1825666 RepID=A0AAD9ID83_9PEZI|nr:hypothetical protein P8C59_008870 [Phyllachora maydis]